jgi:4'-phosphopantetheinyl transferase
MLASAGVGWAPGPARPQLGEGAVHVWRADLRAVGEGLEPLLDGEEHARAAGMLRAQDRQLWARSRGLLRALLGRYLETDPGELLFVPGEHGKPELAEGPFFNTAHSGALALYAFSKRSAVGVDVEVVRRQVARRPISHVAIAARAFGPAQARRLAALDPAERESEFLRAWARHEAELKCRGTGIGGAHGGGDAGATWIAELDVGPGAGAAVALDAAPRELRSWDWL